jgi:hypothetical protein
MVMGCRIRFCSTLLAVAISVLPVCGDDRSLEQNAWRILKTQCFSCHGGEKQDGGLRLDGAEAIQKGGDRGAVFDTKTPADSLLLRAIRFEDDDLQMPPKLPLSSQEIATLTDWVTRGAAWPEVFPTDAEEVGTAIGDAFTDERNPIRQLFGSERLDLWSLKAPKFTAPPDSKIVSRKALAAGNSPTEPAASALPLTDAATDESPGSMKDIGPQLIDGWVSFQLNAAVLRQSAPADRRTLIRRLSFELTGLPPTPEAVDEFVQDDSEGSFEALVDRLLASPAYGERQAQLWLDVVRYADTHGYERDEFRPLIWRYRDYVVRSFNADKPYDQFVREQLAGDELLLTAKMAEQTATAHANPSAATLVAECESVRTKASLVEAVDLRPRTAAEADLLIATGFLRLGQWDSTAAIFQEEDRLRAEMLADLTNTTASAFLGLTMSCCQCHDHKYDPLSQADHFRLRAFFAGCKSRDDLVIDLPEVCDRIAVQNADIDARSKNLKAEQARLKGNPDSELRVAELDQEMKILAAKKESLQLAMGVAEEGVEVPATHLLVQGDFSAPRDAVDPGFVSLLDPRPASITSAGTLSSGRRLALANWITSPNNPWTARVLVNRIWQQHFGRGLVSTPNDFGYSGDAPSHPELLDSLAVLFVQNDWTIKDLHRAIVLSRTWQQSSNADESLQTVASVADPDNRLLWKQSMRRLDAETLRDSMLFVSGLLKPVADGNPRWPEVPGELLSAQPSILEAQKNDDDGRMQGWYTDPVEQTDVRSLFLIRKRSLPVPFLQTFDLPDTTVSCARRDSTVVAPQALMLLNSPEAFRFCDAFASRVSADTYDRESAVTAVFRFALQRAPDDDEQMMCHELLNRHAQGYAGTLSQDEAEHRARRDLCRAVLNLNEFAYVD